jgi:hypothetical protein
LTFSECGGGIKRRKIKERAGTGISYKGNQKIYTRIPIADKRGGGECMIV